MTNTKGRLLRSSNIFLRGLELAVGIATAALGWFLYVYINVQDISGELMVSLWVRALAFLMLCVPGTIVAAGAYIQAVRNREWGFILLFVGVVANLIFVVFNAGLNYAFVEDRWGQIAISADFVTTLFILGIAIINAIVSLGFSKGVEDSREA